MRIDEVYKRQYNVVKDGKTIKECNTREEAEAFIESKQEREVRVVKVFFTRAKHPGNKTYLNFGVEVQDGNFFRSINIGENEVVQIIKERADTIIVKPQESGQLQFVRIKREKDCPICHKKGVMG